MPLILPTGLCSQRPLQGTSIFFFFYFIIHISALRKSFRQCLASVSRQLWLSPFLFVVAQKGKKVLIFTFSKPLNLIDSSRVTDSRQQIDKWCILFSRLILQIICWCQRLTCFVSSFLFSQAFMVPWHENPLTPTNSKKNTNPTQINLFQWDSYVNYILIIFHSPIKWVNRKLLLSFDKHSNWQGFSAVAWHAVTHTTQLPQELQRAPLGWAKHTPPWASTKQGCTCCCSFRVRAASACLKSTQQGQKSKYF